MSGTTYEIHVVGALVDGGGLENRMVPSVQDNI